MCCVKAKEEKYAWCSGDIVCYKILTKNFTSVRNHKTKWKVGKTNSIKRKKPDYCYDPFYDGYTVEGGGYHSFKTIKDVVQYTKSIIKKFDEFKGKTVEETAQILSNNRLLIKCVIPKNSKFVWTGVQDLITREDTDFFQINCYVSEKLKPIEVLEWSSVTDLPD